MFKYRRSAATLALLGVTAAAGCVSPPQRRDLQIRGSGALGDTGLLQAFEREGDWHPTRTRLVPEPPPQQGDECTTTQINKPLNRQQAAALTRFMNGETQTRYDPQTGQRSTMLDYMVGWVCTPDGKRTTLWSAGGRLLVLGPTSLDDPMPYGDDLLTRLNRVLPQGRMVAAFQLSEEAIGLVGSDGGLFTLRDGHGPGMPAPILLRADETATAAFVTTSGGAVALVVNRGGPDRNPALNASVIPTTKQRLLILGTNADERATLFAGLKERMHFAPDFTVTFDLVSRA